MKNIKLGSQSPRAKGRAIQAATVLFSFAILVTACTGQDQANSQVRHEADETLDLVKEVQSPEKKELPEDLAPLEISVPEAGPLGDPEEEAKRAEAVVSAVINVTEQIATRGDGQSDGLEVLTEGFVKGQLEAMAAERWQMGVKQTGNAKVVSVSPKNIDLDAEQPTMDLQVCLDLSGIDVVDENGVSFEGLLYKPENPVLNVYGAVFIDDRWKISTHSIPDDSACNDASSKES